MSKPHLGLMPNLTGECLVFLFMFKLLFLTPLCSVFEFPRIYISLILLTAVNLDPLNLFLSNFIQY